MRKFPFIFLLLLLHAVNASADLIEPSSRVTSRLKIKQAPSSNASVVTYLYPGQRLPLLASDNRYYHEVQLPNQISGWVSKSWSHVIPSTSQASTLAITFFNVGQGDSTLIACPNGHNILIDAGSTSGVEADVIRDQLFTALEGRDRHIHTLVVTHPDADHYNRLHLVLQDVNVDQVLMVGIEEDYYKYFWSWLNAIGADINVLSVTDFNQPTSPNTGLDCGEAQSFILAADEQSSFSSKNTSSIVLMIRYKNFESIFTGDATKITEEVIINRYPVAWLDIDLLKIGHHGSFATSTTNDWASILSPEIAVVSAGDNRYGHPRTEVLDRLDDYTVSATPHLMNSAKHPNDEYVYEFNNNYNEAIYSTQVSGIVQVASDGLTWSVKTISTEQ